MKRLSKLLACLASIGTLAACASTTGVVPIGDGMFMLSKQDYYSWSGGKAKAELYGEAAAYCKGLGKEPSPISDSSKDATMYGNYASAEIKFRCK